VAEPDPEPRQAGGIVVTRGMSLRIPAGGLRISMGPDGLDAEMLSLHVSRSMWLPWLEIAMSHLEA